MAAVKIWKIPITERYPLGIKFRMVLVDVLQKKILLLFDNHWPKGPHLHIGEKEQPYYYTGIINLLIDFKNARHLEENKYHENKKNSH